MGIRITDLPTAETVELADTLVLVQNGDTKKCQVTQVRSLNASEITSGTLNAARLPLVPVSTGGTGSTDAVSALAALGAQPALTSSAPATIVQGGTGETTALAALTALGGVSSSTSITAGDGLVGGGTLDANRVIALQTTGVAAGTFGSASTVAQFTVNDKGQITNAENVGISGSAGGTVVSVGATSSTLSVSSTPVIYSGALQINLATTGIAAITAGSSTQCPVITVDTYGRVTALSTTAINSLTPSGVIPGTYGSASQIPAFAVDQFGRVTSGTNNSISLVGATLSSIKENITVSATAATQARIQFDVATQNVLYYTLPATGAFTFNIRGNSSTSLNDYMSIGQSISIAFLTETGNPTYGINPNSPLTIDGVALEFPVKWVNGAFPTATTNAINAYLFTIIKAASGIGGWRVLGEMISYKA